jgi:hypothetical protein
VPASVCTNLRSLQCDRVSAERIANEVEAVALSTRTRQTAAHRRDRPVPDLRRLADKLKTTPTPLTSKLARS